MRLVEADESTRPVAQPLETLLIRFGLLTLPQLAEANRAVQTTGRPLTEVLVEGGWVTAENLAKVVGEKPAPEAEVVVEPEPEPDPEPAPEIAAEPVAAEPTTFTVYAQLVNGERIELESHDDEQSAKAAAESAVQRIEETEDGWPKLGALYLRPDAVVSVEIVSA